VQTNQSMHRCSHYIAGAAAALLLLTCNMAPVSAGENEVPDIAVPSADGPIHAKLFAAEGDGKRPAVIILHGGQGLGDFADGYAQYAQSIAAKGMDAFLLFYYSDADTAAMKSSDRAARAMFFNEHLGIWSKRVRDLISLITQRGDSSGKVGLLGFSNGGFLAVASAAADPRVTALVVFYAGIPATPDITHLPPLLALHGDADQIIPLSSGRALVEKARALGGPTELVVYPGAGHIFDFYPGRADGKDAAGRALSFLERQLK
jgi:carboxymethylenebutenolidase